MATHYAHKIPLEEIALSFELLGANFLDRQNSPLEAKEAWRYALQLYKKSILQRKPTLHSLSIADFISKESNMEWVDDSGDNYSRSQNKSEPMEFNTNSTVG